MKKLFFLTFLLALIAAKTTAQNTDKQKIEYVINALYLEGWMTGDTTKVGKAMHATCHLKTYANGTFNDISRNDYLSRFKPREKSADTQGRIVSLDITAHIAAAKVEISTPKATFTDYFNLMRIGDEWFIVDKISARVDK